MTGRVSCAELNSLALTARPVGMEAGFPRDDPETTRRFAVRLNLQHRWGNQLQLLWVAPHIGQLAETGLFIPNPLSVLSIA